MAPLGNRVSPGAEDAANRRTLSPQSDSPQGIKHNSHVCLEVILLQPASNGILTTVSEIPKQSLADYPHLNCQVIEVLLYPAKFVIILLPSNRAPVQWVHYMYTHTHTHGSKRFEMTTFTHTKTRRVDALMPE